MNGANCPAVRRGCVNEQTGEAQRLLCGEAQKTRCLRVSNNHVSAHNNTRRVLFFSRRVPTVRSS